MCVCVYILHLIWQSFGIHQRQQKEGGGKAWQWRHDHLQAVNLVGVWLLFWAQFTPSWMALSLSLSLSLHSSVSSPMCLLSCDETNFSFSVSTHVAFVPGPFPAFQCFGMQYWKAGNGTGGQDCNNILLYCTCSTRIWSGAHACLYYLPTWQ